MYALVVVAAISAVIVAGHFLSRPLFHFIAATGLREAFTAAALMLVIGIAVLMSLVGLSPALGTFLAGVVLANSEFRHELESTIEPFKGLLLGLFFITVGAGVQFSILADSPALVLALTAAVIGVKAALLFPLAFAFRLRGAEGWLFTLSLAQAGEFGFVLISYAAQNSVLAPALLPVLSLVVALSMFLTPLLFIAFDRIVLPRYAANATQRDSDRIEEPCKVLIAGSGRFGQIVNRLLRASGIATVVLDRSPQQIANMREVGIKSFFGDATQPELLEAAGIADARLCVVAIDDRDQALALTRHLKHKHPAVRVLARGYDRGHEYLLREAGADWVVGETYCSALETGRQALYALDLPRERADRLTAAFADLEREGRDALYAAWLEKGEGERYGRGFTSLFIELEESLRASLQAGLEGDAAAAQSGPPPAADEERASQQRPTDR